MARTPLAHIGPDFMLDDLLLMRKIAANAHANPKQIIKSDPLLPRDDGSLIERIKDKGYKVTENDLREINERLKRFSHRSTTAGPSPSPSSNASATISAPQRIDPPQIDWSNGRVIQPADPAPSRTRRPVEVNNAMSKQQAKKQAKRGKAPKPDQTSQISKPGETSTPSANPSAKPSAEQPAIDVKAVAERLDCKLLPLPADPKTVIAEMMKLRMTAMRDPGPDATSAPSDQAGIPHSVIDPARVDHTTQSGETSAPLQADPPRDYNYMLDVLTRNSAPLPPDGPEIIAEMLRLRESALANPDSGPYSVPSPSQRRERLLKRRGRQQPSDRVEPHHTQTLDIPTPEQASPVGDLSLETFVESSDNPAFELSFDVLSQFSQDDFDADGPSCKEAVPPAPKRHKTLRCKCGKLAGVFATSYLELKELRLGPFTDSEHDGHVNVAALEKIFAVYGVDINYGSQTFRTDIAETSLVESLFADLPNLRSITLYAESMPMFYIWRDKRRCRKSGPTWLVLTGLARSLDQFASPPPRAPFVIPPTVHAIWRYSFIADWPATPKTTPRFTEFSPLGDQIQCFHTTNPMSFHFAYQQMQRCCERRRCPRSFTWDKVVIYVQSCTIDELQALLELLQPNHIHCRNFHLQMARPTRDAVSSWQILLGSNKFPRLLRKFKHVHLDVLHYPAVHPSSSRVCSQRALRFGAVEALCLSRMRFYVQPLHIPDDCTFDWLDTWERSWLLFSYMMQDVVGRKIEAYASPRAIDVPTKVMKRLENYFFEQYPLQNAEDDKRRECLREYGGLKEDWREEMEELMREIDRRKKAREVKVQQGEVQEGQVLGEKVQDEGAQADQKISLETPVASCSDPWPESV